MTFLIVLLALILEWVLHVGQFLYRFCCFESYVSVLRSWFNKLRWWQGYIGVAIIVIPLLLLVVILFLVFHKVFYHIIYYVISLLILLYCLGPEDFNARLKQYFNACEAGNYPAGLEKIRGIVGIESEMLESPYRFITLAIFSKFNENIFAVLFWFVILGPLGAVLYRTIALTNQHANKAANQDVLLATAAHSCQNILDWIPLRLLSLGYALVGNFQPTFKYWLANVISEPAKNQQLIEQTGMLALNSDSYNLEGTLEENKLALELTQRTLIVYSVVLALITISMWA
jgi:membrane protein required for beta-lactamase induction